MHNGTKRTANTLAAEQAETGYDPDAPREYRDRDVPVASRCGLPGEGQVPVRAKQNSAVLWPTVTMVAVELQNHPAAGGKAGAEDAASTVLLVFPSCIPALRVEAVCESRSRRKDNS